jgi:hypothetical protein
MWFQKIILAIEMELIQLERIGTVFIFTSKNMKLKSVISSIYHDENEKVFSSISSAYLNFYFKL